MTSPGKSKLLMIRSDKLKSIGTSNPDAFFMAARSFDAVKGAAEKNEFPLRTDFFCCGNAKRCTSPRVAFT